MGGHMLRNRWPDVVGMGGHMFRNTQYSLINLLQETPIFLADLSRLLKRPGTFFLETAKVALNVPDVELEIAPDDVGVVPHGLRIARDEWPAGRVAGLGGRGFGEEHEQKYNVRRLHTTQPGASCATYFLDQMHPGSLFVG